MLEGFLAGGPTMVPLLLASVLALTLIFERLLALRTERVLPAALRGLTPETLPRIAPESLGASPLGRLLAVAQTRGPGEGLKGALEQQAAQELQGLERYLTLLGILAMVTPLLGMLGTVLGMIDVFSSLDALEGGAGALLAGGIGAALISTATGLTIAIPALMAHRLLSRRVDELMNALEHCLAPWLQPEPSP
jgi:biopolymer transport protein ExbB